MTAKTQTIGVGDEKVKKNQQILKILLPKSSLRSNQENKYPHFYFICIIVH